MYVACLSTSSVLVNLIFQADATRQLEDTYDPQGFFDGMQGRVHVGRYHIS